MSISRTFLRALGCVAIQEQDDDPLPPTMAQHRVFDSSIGTVPDAPENSYTPIAVVYTDDDEGTLINRGSGAGPFHRCVDLRIELLLGTFDTNVETGEQKFHVDTTDPERELMLDLFEAQVRWALTALPTRCYTNAFLRFVVRIESITSRVERGEGNNKYASRTVIFKCVINDDCPPFAAGIGSKQPKPLPAELDFEKFPSPWLRETLNVMKRTPSMRTVLDVLSGSGNPYAFAPLLERMGIAVRGKMGATSVYNNLEEPDDPNMRDLLKRAVEHAQTALRDIGELTTEQVIAARRAAISSFLSKPHQKPNDKAVIAAAEVAAFDAVRNPTTTDPSEKIVRVTNQWEL